MHHNHATFVQMLQCVYDVLQNLLIEMKSVYEDDVELLMIICEVGVRTHYVVSIRSRIYVHALFVVAFDVVKVLAFPFCADFKI